MKTTSIKTLATGIVAFSLLFTACKKSDTTAGPTGPQGPAGVVTTSSDGFIKGTLTGTHRDGTAMNETFSFSNYWGGAAGTLDSTYSSFSGNSYSFFFQRGTDILSSNSAQLSIASTSLTSFASAIATLNFTYVRSLGTNKQFYFSVSNVTPVLSGVTYTASTGIITGTFNITIAANANSTNHAATISGTFQSTITKNYYRLMHQAGIIKK